MKLEIHPEAEAEFHDAAAYYGKIHLELGHDLIDEFETQAAAILSDPLLYNVRSNGFRRANLDRFPYYLPFLIKEETVYILAFAHHSRRPDYWIHRTSL